MSQADFLSDYFKKNGVGPTQSEPHHLSTETIVATAEAIHWIGIVAGLFLIGHATFWLFEAVSSVIFRMPKQFDIGFWAFIFPFGTYANALSYVSNDLRNEGLKGWAATCTVTVLLLWVLCAVGTLYRGFWKGELFYAPGLEDWLPENPERGHHVGRRSPGSDDQPSNTHSKSSVPIDIFDSTQRAANHDGMDFVRRLHPSDEESRGGGDSHCQGNGEVRCPRGS